MSEKSLPSLSVEQVISTLSAGSDIPELLLHTCCAPCAGSVIEYLLPYFNITLYFNNPNIQPVDEYNKRALEVENRLMKLMAAEYNRNGEERVKLIICDYDGADFEAIALKYPDEPEGGKRCVECFKLRLENTAQVANRDGYDFFTTTLSVSPHKNAGLINEVGCELSVAFAADKPDRERTQFLCADFKKRGGYERSIELSKQLNLYRQNYCGCHRSKLR